MSMLLRRGVMSGGVTSPQTFAVNSADLNGSSQYFTYPAAVSDGAAIFTVAIWINTASLAADQFVWNEETTTADTPRAIMYIDTAGKVAIGMRSATGGAATISTTVSTVISINTDYFIMALIDTTNNELKIFINGSEETTDNPTPTMSAIFSGAPDDDSAIGAYTTGTDFFVDGTISFLDAWTSDQTGSASYLYNSGTPICYDSRIAAAKIGEQMHIELANWTGHTGQELDDQTGNGNNVTNIGSTPFTGTGLTVECT